MFNFAVRRAGNIPTYGDLAVQALDSIKDARGYANSIASELSESRAAYWSAYTGGSVTPEIENRYTAALLSKDMYYAYLHAQAGVYNRDAGGFNALRVVSGGVDGGIYPGAQRAFADWLVAHLAEAKGEPRSGAPAEELLKAYIWRRDLMEFQKAGQVPPGFTPTEWKAVGILNRLLIRKADNHKADESRFMLSSIDPVGSAVAEVWHVVHEFGAEALEQSVRVTEGQGESLGSELPAAAHLVGVHSKWTMDGFYDCLPASTMRQWFLSVFRLNDGRDSPHPIQDAISKWEYFNATYGSKAVEEAVERVQSLDPVGRKTRGYPQWYFVIDNAASLGVEPRNFYVKGYEVIAAITAMLEGRSQARRDRIERGGAEWTEDEVRPLAERGVVWAQVETAKLRVSKNDQWAYSFSGDEKELGWLVNAAQGHAQTDPDAAADAAYILAELSRTGRVDGGDTKAVEWLSIAAEAGHADARGLLSVMLYQGLGTEHDDPRRAPRETYRLADLSETRKSPIGNYAMGLHMEDGKGLDTNERLASLYMKRAAEAGYPPAMEWCARNSVDYQGKAAKAVEPNNGDRSTARERRRRRRP